MYSCAHKVFALFTFKLCCIFFAMAPPHGNCQERSLFVESTLCTSMLCGVTSKLRIGKLRVLKVVKRGNLRGGYVEDAWRSGHSRKNDNIQKNESIGSN